MPRNQNNHHDLEYMMGIEVYSHDMLISQMQKYKDGLISKNSPF